MSTPARRHRPSLIGAWLVAAAVTAALGTACRDIVTDDVTDAEAELCGRLDACGLDGCPQVRSFFAAATAVDADALLTKFAEERCADGCGDAPICLDLPGLCTPPGGPCTSDVLCCDASGGEARCQVARGDVEDGAGGAAAQGASGLCCRGLGVRCIDDAECCELESGEAPSCRPPDGERGAPATCGGVPACLTLGEGCAEDAQCCSRSCEGGACVRIRCVESGAPCADGDTCCSESERCEGGICRTPAECPGDPDCPCGGQGATCTPEAEGTCCPDLYCVTTLDGASECASTDCLPLGADCASDEDCQCKGERPEVVCLEIAAGGVGAPKACQVLPCEAAEGAACGPGRPCCASYGLACDAEPGSEGVCKPQCEPTSCHSPLSYGPPITPLEGPVEPTDECMQHAACASAVCEVDPYCCCFLWDEICVEQAKTIGAAGGACPAGI